MRKKTVVELLEYARSRQVAEDAGLPRFKCACGQELWAEKSARVICAKCFGAFRQCTPKDTAA